MVLEEFVSLLVVVVANNVQYYWNHLDHGKSLNEQTLQNYGSRILPHRERGLDGGCLLCRL